jgi:hypothetical protein
MRVEVFDDKFSLIHFLLGLIIALAGNRTIALMCFVIYVIFEIVEHLYKYPIEAHIRFFGDLVEFMFGIGSGCIVKMTYVW